MKKKRKELDLVEKISGTETDNVSKNPWLIGSQSLSEKLLLLFTKIHFINIPTIFLFFI